MRKRLFMTLTCLMVGQLAFGQLFPERSDIRKGNKEYEKENYVEAESKYMGALSKNPGSYEAHFNLGNSYYRQGRFEEAEQRFQQLGQVPYLPEQWAQTCYNQGNSLVSQYQADYNREKLQQALETYKQSLRLNPNDQEAKFNLAYVQKLLENDDEGDGGGDGDNDQDNDQDQNNDQNQDDQDNPNDPNDDPDENGDPDNDPNDQDQDPDDSDKDGQQPPPEGRMSREEAEQMLNAVQNSEDQTREKVDQQEAGVVSRSGKNW